MSVMRRALPAISTRSAAGCARRCSTISSPIVSTADSSSRSAGPSSSSSASARAMFCSAFGPSPETDRRRSCSAACAQLLERGDAELGVDPAGGLGAQAREAREPHQLAGELRAQLHGRGDVAGLEQGQDLLLERLPDVAQLGRAALAGELRDGHRRVADRLGGLAVGDHPVDDGAVQLVEVAELVHRGRDLRVRHAAKHRGAILPRCWRAPIPAPCGSSCRPTTSGTTSSRSCAPCAPRCRARRPTTRSWSWTTPRPTGPESSPTGWRRTTRTCRSCTARARRASGRPTWPDSSWRCARGAELMLEMDADFSHDPPTCRR